MSAAPDTESSQCAKSQRKRTIEDQTRAALDGSSYPELRRVKCEYEAGIVTLRGRLTSFYSMQIALRLVRSNVDGDVLIRNLLDIEIPPSN
jgi:hypothetical protein